ncbi:MAG: ATP-binding protein [Actinomycetota bacterium]|nr:ATP-binding protein [Actinomycetota bacterium]
MEFAFSLTLPREALSIPVARRILGSTMLDLGIEKRCVEDVEIVATEACTNVLKHAEPGSADYEVEVSITHDRADIKIKDRGPGFHEGSQSEGRVLDPTEEGGRGILLMRAFVDRVEFLNDPESGTVVHLSKDLVLADGSLLDRRGALPNLTAPKRE